MSSHDSHAEDAEAQAAAMYKKLVAAGKAALLQTGKTDVFAKFGEDPTAAQRKAQAHFVSALGYTGPGETDNARAELTAALKERPDHPGAKDALARLN